MSPLLAHASHLKLRALAKKLGIAVSTVFGILNCNGLKPHRVKTFKVSRDPKFEPKIYDVVGFNVDPPNYAIVILVDEKTQVQALGRTQATLADEIGPSRDPHSR